VNECIYDGRLPGRPKPVHLATYITVCCIISHGIHVTV